MIAPAVFAFDTCGVAVFADARAAETCWHHDGVDDVSQRVAIDELGQRLELRQTGPDFALAPTDVSDLDGLRRRLRELVRPRAMVDEPNEFAEVMLSRRPPIWLSPIRAQKTDCRTQHRVALPSVGNIWACQVLRDGHYSRMVDRHGFGDVRESSEFEREVDVANREWGPEHGYAAVSSGFGAFRVRGPIAAGSVRADWTAAEVTVARELVTMLGALNGDSRGGGHARSVGFRFISRSRQSAQRLRAALFEDVGDAQLSPVRNRILERRPRSWRIDGVIRLEMSEPLMREWLTKMVCLADMHESAFNGCRVQR